MRGLSNLRRSMSTSKWADIKLAPPDKILGLNAMFRSDKNPKKISLGVGAYRDDKGKPFILNSIREAEKRIFNANMDHEYAGIEGVQDFVDLSLEFAYGMNSPVLKEKRVAAVQTLSGTGACRLTGEFVATFVGKGKKIYMPNPTWGNHIPIMRNSGLVPAEYKYYDSKTRSFDFKGMSQDLLSIENGSVLLIHAVAHNPTGCDPSPAEWDQLSQIVKEKNHTCFFDCAYQGFASGDSETDAYSLRKFVADGHQIILSQSFAKNFGLYGERIGTLSVVTADADETARVNSQLKLLVRPMYSNPPVHGARIVKEVLSDPELKKEWASECKAMAARIQSMRSLLRNELESLGSAHSWKHITDQIGMFCFTGLTTPQVLELREKYSIYCTDDGRISVAGVNSANVKYLANAIHEVTK